MKFKQIGQDGMNRIHLVQGRDKWQAVVEKLMNLQVPHNARDLLTSCGTA